MGVCLCVGFLCVMETLLFLPGKASLESDTAVLAPGPAFKEVWQVSLRPRGLGQTKNLAGLYLLCLTEKAINFVKLNSAGAALVLQLLNVRRCGHSENYFFMEVGRSAATGPGELWMQVEDLVVAQNMHETILDAMKALSEEFRVRHKSQALASTPISVPPRCPPPSQVAFPWRPRPEGTPPHLTRSPPAVPQGQKGQRARKPDSLSDYSALSSDEGGSSPSDSRPLSAPDPLSYMVVAEDLDYISMGKEASSDGRCLAKWALKPEPSQHASLPPVALDKAMPSLPPRNLAAKPVAVSASSPEGLNHSRDPGYMAMLPGVALSTEDQDYVPMTPGSVSPPRESGGYMLMSPNGSCSPDGHSPWVPGKALGRSYVNMSPLSRSASSTPPEYSPLLATPGGAAHCALPRSYQHAPKSLPGPFEPGQPSCSSSTSSESLEEVVGAPCLAQCLLGDLSRANSHVHAHAVPRTSGEYAGGAEYVNMAIRVAPAESGRMAVADSYAEMAPGARLVRADPQGRRRHCLEVFPEVGMVLSEAKTESGLNYIDLDLAKDVNPEIAPASRGIVMPGQSEALNPYASIDFHRLGEICECKRSSEKAGKGGGLDHGLGGLTVKLGENLAGYRESWGWGRTWDLDYDAEFGDGLGLPDPFCG